MKEAVQTAEVELNKIIENSNNVRKGQDPDFQNLVENVKANGILQPVILRVHPKKKDSYELLAGHRRFKAAEKAKLTVRDYLAYPGSAFDLENPGLKSVEKIRKELAEKTEEKAKVDTADVSTNIGGAEGGIGTGGMIFYITQHFERDSINLRGNMIDAETFRKMMGKVFKEELG